MTGKLMCQIVLLLLMAISMLFNMRNDINGRPAKEPDGFFGVVITMIVMAILIFIFYHAGAFSLIF